MPETARPFPHLLTHPTRAMLLVFTPEEEATRHAEGYVLVPVDTAKVVHLFRLSMQLRIVTT